MDKGHPLSIMQLATQSATAFRFTLPLARYLRELGHDVVIGCSQEPQTDVPDYHEAIKQEGFQLIHVPIPRRIDLGGDLRAVQHLASHFRSKYYDLVHTHNSKAGVIGRLAGRIARVPFIIHTNHGLPFFKADKFSAVESIFFWAIEVIMARLADRILTVSPTEQDKARRYFIARPPKLVNVGQGIDTNFYSPSAVSSNTVSSRFQYYCQILGDRPIVGSVARLVAEKGIDCLIDASAHCVGAYPDLAVLILGEGPEQERLEAQVRALGLEQNVFFVGFVQDANEVRQFYSLMDIFVLPTRWESFGVVFIEAMSMELPVIGPDIEPIASIIDEGVSGYLVVPDDAAGFGQAILQFLGDEDLRLQMARAGRKSVLNNWSEAAMFERIVTVYDEMLLAKKRPVS